MHGKTTFPDKTRILVIDDDAKVRLFLQESLDSLGFEDVTEASDGNIAWQMILESLQEDKPFGLIISDLEMVEMGGIELLRRIRNNKDTANVPFVMVTAHGELSAVIKSAEAKVSGYIVKPFKVATLAAKLSNLYLAQKKADETAKAS